MTDQCHAIDHRKIIELKHGWIYNYITYHILVPHRCSVSVWIPSHQVHILHFVAIPMSMSAPTALFTRIALGIDFNMDWAPTVDAVQGGMSPYPSLRVSQYAMIKNMVGARRHKHMDRESRPISETGSSRIIYISYAGETPTDPPSARCEAHYVELSLATGPTTPLLLAVRPTVWSSLAAGPTAWGQAE
ncbi:hypothetical protein B0H10DRAFT_1954833 [Mycena sp. CBHHK59/15]|nr:hypothetical protein B0H10DRAFT_1954833 [Mycena sp. CBHHK59/15]